MKRALCVLSALFTLFTAGSAQSLSLKVGTVVLNHGGVMNNQRFEALFAYPVSDKFDVTLATGYDRSYRDSYSFTIPGGEIFIVPENRIVRSSGGTTVYPAITYHFIPIVAGVKYSFVKNIFSPYLTAELGKYFDLTSKSAIEARSGGRRFEDDNIGNIIKLGGGLQYRYSEKLIFDLSTRLIHESTDAETIEIMAGILLPL